MEEESYFIGYFRYNQGSGENFLWAGWGRTQRSAKKRRRIIIIWGEMDAACASSDPSSDAADVGDVPGGQAR
jgi:hypothetical protein